MRVNAFMRACVRAGGREVGARCGRSAPPARRGASSLPAAGPAQFWQLPTVSGPACDAATASASLLPLLLLELSPGQPAGDNILFLHGWTLKGRTSAEFAAEHMSVKEFEEVSRWDTLKYVKLSPPPTRLTKAKLQEHKQHTKGLALY